MLKATQFRNQRFPAGGWASQNQVLAFQRTCTYSFFLRRIQLGDSALDYELFELLGEREFSNFQFGFAINRCFIVGLYGLCGFKVFIRGENGFAIASGLFLGVWLMLLYTAIGKTN
jgi:hypothetical protein